jgi:hypothetical protein
MKVISKGILLLGNAGNSFPKNLISESGIFKDSGRLQGTRREKAD